MPARTNQVMGDAPPPRVRRSRPRHPGSGPPAHAHKARPGTVVPAAAESRPALGPRLAEVVPPPGITPDPRNQGLPEPVPSSGSGHPPPARAHKTWPGTAAPAPRITPGPCAPSRPTLGPRLAEPVPSAGSGHPPPARTRRGPARWHRPPDHARPSHPGMPRMRCRRRRPGQGAVDAVASARVKSRIGGIASRMAATARLTTAAVSRTWSAPRDPAAGPARAWPTGIMAREPATS